MKIVAASGYLQANNCTKISMRRGSAPDSTVRTYSALPSPQLMGAYCPKNPTPPRRPAHFCFPSAAYALPLDGNCCS